jgi:hypothetical protein
LCCFPLLDLPQSPYTVHRRGVAEHFRLAQADSVTRSNQDPEGLPPSLPSARRLLHWLVPHTIPSAPRYTPLRMRVCCRQPAAVNALWYGPYRSLQGGVELGSVLLLQFSLERGNLLLGLCERGRCAANLRDEFVIGGAVHCSPHSQSPHGDPANFIAEKVNQRLTLETAKPR